MLIPLIPLVMLSASQSVARDRCWERAYSEGDVGGVRGEDIALVACGSAKRDDVVLLRLRLRLRVRCERPLGACAPIGAAFLLAPVVVPPSSARSGRVLPGAAAVNECCRRSATSRPASVRSPLTRTLHERRSISGDATGIRDDVLFASAIFRQHPFR